MATQQTLQAVIDTNVLFEGITIQGSAPGLIMEAWRGGLFRACVSTTLAYEYLAVCSGKLSAVRWQQLQPVVGALLTQARFVPIYFSWRPMSPDPGDEQVIDGAMNARAPVVTANTRDFRLAAQTLGDFSKRISLITLLKPGGSGCPTWATEGGAPIAFRLRASPAYQAKSPFDRPDG